MAEKTTNVKMAHEDAQVAAPMPDSSTDEVFDATSGEVADRSLSGSRMRLPATLSLPTVLLDGHHQGHGPAREAACHYLEDEGWDSSDAIAVTAGADVVRLWTDGEGFSADPQASNVGARPVSMVVLTRALPRL